MGAHLEYDKIRIWQENLVIILKLRATGGRIFVWCKKNYLLTDLTFYLSLDKNPNRDEQFLSWDFGHVTEF